MFKDWCPLCGSRFEGESAQEVCDLIIEHIDDKTCVNNFRPLAVALSDSSFEAYDNGSRYTGRK